VGSKSGGYCSKKSTFTSGQNIALKINKTVKKEQHLKRNWLLYLEASKVEPAKVQVWFWDEAGFSLRVIRRKNWSQKGRRKKVTGQRSSGKVNVMGAVRFHDRKRICFFVEKGNSNIFYEQLQQFYEQIVQEWIGQGNKAEEFTEKGTKIFIVLDNASYHKKKIMLADIEQNLPNIQLYFLPPYSPDYNLTGLRQKLAKTKTG